MLKLSDDTDAKKPAFKLQMLPSEEVEIPFQTLSAAISSSNAGKDRRHSETADDHEPRIDLKRDGEQITRITITCGCVMEIECEDPA